MGKTPRFRPCCRPPQRTLWQLIAAVAVGIVLALCLPLWVLLAALALAAIILMFCFC